MKYPIPFLEFRDPAGIDLPFFATFRLGGSWEQKVKVRNRVLLATGHLIVSSAKVTAVHVGPAMEILRRYAVYSHLERAIHRNDPSLYVEAGAAERRFASMRKLYGPHKLNEGTKITAIFLKRCRSSARSPHAQ